jgi:hypothetical protein
MIDVDSDNLEKIGYDRKARILRLKFHASKALYDYSPVPPTLYKRLMASESKGHFFQQNIKDKFDYTRLLEATRDLDSLLKK